MDDPLEAPWRRVSLVAVGVAAGALTVVVSDSLLPASTVVAGVVGAVPGGSGRRRGP